MPWSRIRWYNKPQKMINLSFNLLKNKIIGNRSRLGIYFGKDRISAVEITGSHILKTASLNLPKLPPALNFRDPSSGQDLNVWAQAIRGFIKRK